MEPKYYLKDNEFVIENYNQAKPFASFLPGIAGLFGKPLWAFYVNRGQCMASFGTNSKEGAIMEFYPANTAYRRTSVEGFRTFVKIRPTVGKPVIYEPFMVQESKDGDAPLQKLCITPYEMRIEETNKDLGLKFEALYYTVPGESFPALARVLKVENISGRNLDIEIIDGMPKLEPAGMNDWLMKNMSRTIEAWMEVLGLEDKTAFYKLRVDAADVAEVKYITSGNFYLSMVGETWDRPELIADPRVVFGSHTDMTEPGAFYKEDFRVPGKQIDKNITPSAFSYCRMRVKTGQAASLLSLIGHAESMDELKKISRKLSPKFFQEKRALNKEETDRMASSLSVVSEDPLFDMYVKQNNLDNILRGGYPLEIGEGKLIYVFNRKHGDLERDYNSYVLRAEYYSQGNGNFRDTNQNRRNSIWIAPKVGRKDIKDFFSLVQFDGYNPLVVKGDLFTIKDNKDRTAIANKYFKKESKQEALTFLSKPFTPGEFMKFAEKANLSQTIEAAFRACMDKATSKIDAEHGEGFWVDHWTYDLDLVESFLAVFPEQEEDLIFRDKTYTTFDERHRVKPRCERYVTDAKKRPRQYDAVVYDKAKKELMAARRSDPNWARTDNGNGRVYECALAAKMLVLIANKIATLDVRGVGIEMEAGKPGWCDSMNGLPGLFGSSLCETFELARIAGFLKDAAARSADGSVELPVELFIFIKGLSKELARNLSASGKKSDFEYWDRSNALKETYRDNVRMGIKGKEAVLDKKELIEFLGLAVKKLEKGIAAGRDENGVPYTYFTNVPKNVTKGKAAGPFDVKALPLFLEGPVHAMKYENNISKAKTLYYNIKKSELYDEGLGMYRLNASLAKESLDIGRSRVFTPGWLENESVWLHMEYKYMLEVLKKGLYDEFFSDFAKALIPFQDPARYGRSVLENSSFIASSKFFDESLRGNGFVARLSGATAEFNHMLLLMNLGKKPFGISGGKLVFTPAPVIPARFFTKSDREAIFYIKGKAKTVSVPKGSYAFNIFGDTIIIYSNPAGRDTFGRNAVRPVRYNVRYKDGRIAEVPQDALCEPFATHLREGKIENISILLG